MEELSYIDLLIKLRLDIESDAIPDDDKADAFNLIEALWLKLWKYSY